VPGAGLARAMLLAQALMSFQLRKSPSGNIARAAGIIATRPVFESKLLGVECSEEDPMVSGVDGLPELGNLFGLCDDEKVSSLGVLDLATEQPHLPVG